MAHLKLEDVNLNIFQAYSILLLLLEMDHLEPT